MPCDDAVCVIIRVRLHAIVCMTNSDTQNYITQRNTTHVLNVHVCINVRTRCYVYVNCSYVLLVLLACLRTFHVSKYEYLRSLCYVLLHVHVYM